MTHAINHFGLIGIGALYGTAALAAAFGMAWAADPDMLDDLGNPDETSEFKPDLKQSDPRYHPDAADTIGPDQAGGYDD